MSLLSVKNINIAYIEKEAKSRKIRYRELYDKIFALKINEGLEVEFEDSQEVHKVKNAVYNTFSRSGITDRYILVQKANKFYCGRIK